MKAPNVFLLAVDSLRADAVLGGRVPTPNIDSYASRGAVFRQCVSTTTSTTPSFSSILTGCYPPKHGVRGLQGYALSPHLTTLPELFAAAGYRTYAEVTGPLLPETGVLRGFDAARHREGYRVPFMGWRDRVVEEMRSYVEPWFMLLHVWEVHRPYRSPPDFEKRWDRAGYEAAVAAVDEALAPVFEAAGDDAIVVITGDHGEDFPDSAMGLKLIRIARRARDAFNTSRLFPRLDKRLAALTVGHGFSLEEKLVRVPLVIAGPSVPHRVIDDQARHVDILPTLCDSCGLRAPDGIDGRSLRPLIEGRPMPDEPAYMEAVGVKLEGRRISGARTVEWKLIKEGDGPAHLFRLGGDGRADEKHDVSTRHPDVARRLEAFIEEVVQSQANGGSGMTSEEEAVVEKHLRDLGYL